MKGRTLILTLAVLLLCACKGSFVMYDTAQRDRPYFIMPGTRNVASFALLSQDSFTYKIPLYLLGTPKSSDRQVRLEFIDAADTEEIVVGDRHYPVLTARPDVDFVLHGSRVSSGRVQDTIRITLRRSPDISGIYMKLHFRVVEDENFLPMDRDTTNASRIISPEFVLYITDGDPACPEWWKTESKGVDYEWGAYYGRFKPDKYRKMLEYFHGIGEKNPLLYEELVAKYGENIDKEGLERNFMSKQDQAVWASYVLIPLHEYYIQYYLEHPKEQDETFGETGDLTTYTWGNPMRLLR